MVLCKTEVFRPRLKVGSSTVTFTVRSLHQKTSERLFEGLYLKIRTHLRAAESFFAYLPRIVLGEPV